MSLYLWKKYFPDDWAFNNAVLIYWIVSARASRIESTRNGFENLTPTQSENNNDFAEVPRIVSKPDDFTGLKTNYIPYNEKSF